MKKNNKTQQTKRCLLVIIMVLITIVCNAIPAKPGQYRTLKLTNGQTVAARLVGDEHGHFWLGNDGNAYQEDETGLFQMIDRKEMMNAAKERRQSANADRAKRMAKRRAQKGSSNSIEGKKKGIIILVNFKDVKLEDTNNKEYFERVANEEHFRDGDFVGSVHDYFYDQSGGKFDLEFDVVGPYDMPYDMSYYGRNKNGKQGNDQHPASMVIEACKAANNEVDFADYDWDGDQEVDQVYVIYAGKGEADGGVANTIWPHEWTLASAQYYGDGSGPLFLDGVTINTYACGSELNGYGDICGIGTMCHEFSHCLGFPDFYDTSDTGYGVGMLWWDLMDSGSYNGDGYQPAGYSSYERWVAGWLNPIELTTTKSVSDMKSLMDGGDAYIIYNNGNRDEYFLLENRQPEKWDAGLPGKGMLILHVDYNASAWASNSVNNDYTHQRMTWITADGEIDTEPYIDENGEEYLIYSWDGFATDTYPSGIYNSFSKDSKAPAKFYNKNSNGTYYMDGAVKDITQNEDGTISFLYKGVVNIAAPTFSPKAGTYSEAQTVTISCETEGVTIHYTTDGTTPTAESSIYDGPISIDKTTTLKAVSISEEGDESQVSVARYVIRSGTATEVKTFKRVSSMDEVVSGLRYIIACGSKDVAAGELSNNHLNSEEIILSDDVITITDFVEVFTLEENNGKYAFMNREGEYLNAPSTKKLAYQTNAAYSWKLQKRNDGVEMVHTYYGTMTYNANSGSDFFATYTSSASNTMIRANLYVECDEEPAQPQEIIIGNNNYKLVASEEELEGNYRYLIVSNVEDQYIAYNGFDSDKGKAGLVTPVDDVITLTEGSGNAAVPVVLQKQNQKWTIFETEKEEYMGTTKGTNSNNKAYLILNGNVSSDYFRWTISIVDGEATVKNCGKAFYLQYNSSANCFRVYASGQNAISLYKEEQEQQNHGITTAIDAVRSQQKSSALFDLQGRRVINPQKGIYIVNGQKVVIK
jgi:M6 family metalloprotease-like protein